MVELVQGLVFVLAPMDGEDQFAQHVCMKMSYKL